MLELAKVKIERQTEVTEYAGVKVSFGPKILMHPSFALTFKELC